jgi:drug/metabolite transporter (DMT)-like permease
MPIAVAYIGTILIWSTTPLAFKWSISSGYLAGIMARLVLASLCGGLLLLLLRESLPWNPRARRLYFAGGLSLFLTWFTIGWGMQFIPSGWVAVIFGLTPIITSLISAFWLREGRFSPVRFGALLVSVTGLAVIFRTSMDLGPGAALGIGANVVGTFFYAATMVWMKRLNAGVSVSAIATTTTSHATALVMFAAAGLLVGAPLDSEIPARTLAAIAYLGIVGSIVAYTMFFYLLKHLDTTRIAAISLVTPVLSLVFGNLFNDEPLTAEIWLGSGLVVAGLLWFEIDATMARRALAPATVSQNGGKGEGA